MHNKGLGKEIGGIFSVHPVVGKEVVEIVALHLEGEVSIWWFNHLSHARVTAYAYFTQRMMKKFEKKKSKEKKLPPPLAVGEIILAPLQSGLDLLTFGAP